MITAKRYVVVKVLYDPQEYMQEYTIDLPETLTELEDIYGKDMILRVCRDWIERKEREMVRATLLDKVKRSK